MAHKITIRADGTAEAAFAMTPAWHGLGVVLDHPMPSAEALHAAQLDWQVIQREVACVIPETVQTAWGPVEQNRYQAIPSVLANCRSDNGLVLGTVSDQYQVVQNLEAFQFLDQLIENHEMTYESAFSLQGGRKVVLLGRLPKVDTVVPGDDSLRYILMSLHHDGSGAIRFGPCATRVVCANTYAMAIQEGYVKELAISHKGDVKSKLAQARSILGTANEKFDQYAQASRALAAHRMSYDEWDQYLNVLCPRLDPKDPDYTEERARRIQETREAIAQRYLLSDAQRVPGIEQTAWAAFNAVTEHIDHLPRRGATMRAKAEARFNVALYGPGRDQKERAFQTACKFADKELALEMAIENTVLSA
jgi:phage/plasmid-like protein (TIGR03299 family)